MKPLLLHVGSTKTGTSSLQQYLSRHASALAEQGVVYPVAGRRAGGRTAHHNLCYEHQPGRVSSGVFRPEVGVWSEALEEIDRGAEVCGVVSSEAFMNCQPQQVERFQRTLAGRPVKIIAYVRRQDRWLQSAWNQQARFGRCSIDFWSFYESVAARGRGDYHDTLRWWADAFGRENVFVRNFDALESGGIVPDFFSSFLPGAVVPGSGGRDVQTNTKAGVKQLLAVSLIVTECRERLGAEFQMSSSSASRIADYFRNRPGEVTKFSVVSYPAALELYAAFAPSNKRLALVSPSFSRSGGFVAPTPDEFRDYVDMSAVDSEIFSGDERRFVKRMAREIDRASRSS